MGFLVNVVGVTGCNGYLGGVLCRELLKNDFRVIGLDNFYRNENRNITEKLLINPKFEFMYGDAFNPVLLNEFINGVDFIVNFAGVVGLDACDKNPEKATNYNSGICELLTTLNTDKPILQISTGSVYGAIPNGVCTEKSALNPLSLYAKTKLEGETHIKENKNWLIYRLATVFGTTKYCNLRENDLLPNMLCKQSVKDQKLVLYEADVGRTFVSVRDVANAIVFGINNFEKMQSSIYNIGDDANNWSKRQLAEFIREQTDCKIEYKDEGFKDKDARNYKVDYSKINSLWKAKIPMKTGLTELIEHFRRE